MFGVSSAYAQSTEPDITTGLIGHWKLDEQSGTGIIDYASNNDGAFIGGLDPSTDSVSGRLGTALNLDGAGDAIDITGSNGAGHPLNFTNGPFTISAWIKPESSSGTIFAKRDGTGTQYQFIVSAASTLGFLAGSEFGFGATTLEVDGSNWYHAVVVVDGSNNPKFYLNGVPEAWVDQSGSRPYAFSYVDTNAAIGARWGTYPGTSFRFDGALDDVRVYSRVLSDEDIAYLYESFDGNIKYDADSRVPKYFNGENWVSMGERKYIPNAVSFSSAEMLASGSLAGVSDSKMITGSLWVKDNELGNYKTIAVIGDSSGNGEFTVNIPGDDSVRLYGENPSNTHILNITTSASVIDGTWQNILFSFDLSDPAKRHIYIDDVDSFNAASPYTDDFIDLTGSINRVMPATREADIADVWIKTGLYIDFSIEANRRKFIDENGDPAYLGPTGSVPTGSAPDIFLSGDTATWHVNKGTGGGFTENGALSDAASAPGDARGTVISADCTGLGDAHYNESSTGHCYYRVDTGETTDAEAARAACEANNGHLATINSEYEQSIINSLYPGSDTYYIGGQRVPFTGDDTWRWFGGPETGDIFWEGDSSGPAPVGAFANWRGSQPNNGDDACQMIGWSDTTEWEDITCNTQSNYICEVPPTIDAPTTTCTPSISNPVQSSTSDNPDTNHSFSYTVPSVSDGMLIIAIASEDDDNANDSKVTSVTFDGIALEKAVDASYVNDKHAAIFYLPAPDATTGSIYVEAAGESEAIQVGAYTASCVKPQAPEFIRGDGASFPATWDTYVATRTHNALIIDVLEHGGNEGGSLTPGGSQTLLHAVDTPSSASSSIGTSYQIGGTAGQYHQMSWTYGGSNVLAHAIAVFESAGNETDCTNPNRNAGSIIYNGDQQVMQYCDGVNWRAIGPAPGDGTGGCTTPTGSEGELVYNKDYGVMQYCEGDEWVRVGRPLCPTHPRCGGSAIEKIVFTTSNSQLNDGNLGGITGADAICQSAAESANLDGTYMAWIADSDPSSAPATRFTQSSVTYIKPNGEVVANDWADLIDGNLSASLDTHADGSASTSGTNRAFTNVLIDGTQESATDHCSDYTSNSNAFISQFGDRRQTSSTWTDSTTITCDIAYRLYCFEQ